MKDRIFGLEIYNPATLGQSPGGLHQYIQPPTGELSGTTGIFCIDGLGDIQLHFMDSENLLMTMENEAAHWYSYTCAKADDTTYMVVIPQFKRRVPQILTFVWDKQLPQATVVVATVGEDTKRPRLVRSTPYFGERKLPGTPLCGERQGYTTELVGKRIIWQYTPNDEVMHIYTSDIRFRLGKAKLRLAENASDEGRKSYEAHLAGEKTYPIYEEPVYYVKLKDGLYLYSVIEVNQYRLVSTASGSELLAILDTKRERYIGRTFGYTPQEKPNFDLVGAIGRFSDEPDCVESYPYPFYPIP